MRRIFPLSLLLAVGAQQACQRDQATGPQAPRPTFQATKASTSKIAFVSTRDGEREVYVMNGDGSGQTRVSNAGRFFMAIEPGWSPDGGSIAYTSDRVRCDCLYQVTPDGSATTMLTSHGSSSGDFDAAWSPDGRTIAFRRALTDNYEIFRIGADGSGETRLTNSGPFTVNNSYPRWSPDGQQIAVERFLPCVQGCTDGNKTEIFVLNPDGSGLTRLTFTGQNTAAAWSPDGGHIAFTSWRDGNAEIYVMNADGSVQTRLTDNAAVDSGPRWSPDGAKIAFTSSRDGDTEIYLMNADGSSQTRLTQAAGVDAEPSWSPDGRQLAFTSHRDGHAQIYVINADGSGETRLTNDAGDDTDPSWAPLAYPSSQAPAHVVFTTSPPDAVSANTVISPAIQVRVSDGSWDAVPGGVVQLEIGTSPAAGATLSGTTQAKVVDGVATFSDLRIDRPGRGYTLRARRGDISTESAPFTVVGPAAQLGFVVAPPATVEASGPITPAVKVAIQDALGSTVPGATGAVTLALGTNSSGATLTGTTSANAVDGIATFSDLSVDRAGTGYTLTATAAGLTGSTSAAFAVQIRFAQVSTGVNHACGLTFSGAAYCWGSNQFGQLGDGTTTTSPSPVPVAGGLRFAQLSAGWFSTCGVSVDHAAYCWGNNRWGQLGDGTNTQRTTPTSVAGGLSFAMVSTGNIKACGVTTGGVAYCWGGGAEDAPPTAPAPVPGGLTFATVSVGHNYVCGVTTARQAYCWGDNSFGQLGNGTTSFGSEAPLAVAGGLSFAIVSAGHTHACGLTVSGSAYCWGFNRFGSVGDGTTTDRSVPTEVAGGLRFTTVSAGILGYFTDFPDHSCAVTTSGAAYCWGAGEASPALVPGGHTFTSVSASGGQSCGVTSSYEVYCWSGGAPVLVQ